MPLSTPPTKQSSPIFWILASLAGLAAGYRFFIRPHLKRWGSTPAERDQPLPGDGLIPHPLFETTRAISIHATASEIWPWLLQMGYRRAGWYSYDSLERLMGAGDFIEGGSATRIYPELQHIQPGDLMLSAPGVDWFRVEELIRDHALVLSATMNPFTAGTPGADRHSPIFCGTWTFLLQKINVCTTRLVVRLRASYSPLWLMKPFMFFFLEPVHFLMEQKMLRNLRTLIEQRPHPAPNA